MDMGENSENEEQESEDDDERVKCIKGQPKR